MNMKNDNRVVAYSKARELTADELRLVSGAGTKITTGSGDDAVVTCDDNNGNQVECD